MIVTVSGLSGLTNAYTSVLSAVGSSPISGASRWLEAPAFDGPSAPVNAAATAAVPTAAPGARAAQFPSSCFLLSQQGVTAWFGGRVRSGSEKCASRRASSGRARRRRAGSPCPASPSSPGRRRSRGALPCRPGRPRPGPDWPRGSGATIGSSVGGVGHRFLREVRIGREARLAELRDRLVEGSSRDPVARLDELRELGRRTTAPGSTPAPTRLFAITFAAATRSAPAPTVVSQSRRDRP